jgi:hypothetical protein
MSSVRVKQGIASGATILRTAWILDVRRREGGHAGMARRGQLDRDDSADVQLDQRLADRKTDGEIAKSRSLSTMSVVSGYKSNNLNCLRSASCLDALIST